MNHPGLSLKTLSFITIAIIILVSAGGFVYLSTLPAGKKDVYPLSIIDDHGRNVTIKVKPKKIVSLVPSATETIYAAGAGNLIVGVDQFSAYPDDLVKRVKSGNITTLGSGFTPDLDKIISLGPDVIFVSARSQLEAKPLQRLLELGFPIIGLDANSVSGVLHDIKLVGRVTGNSETAEKVVASLKERVTNVQNAVKNSPKVRVYVENWPDPLFSVGPGSIQNDLIELSGGVNVFSDLPRKSAQVTPEAVIAKNPEVVILFEKSVSLDQVKSRPGWNVIDAVRKNRVHYISEEENAGQYGAPGPRIVDGLEKMARLIHPELFKLENARVNALLMLVRAR